MASWLTGSLPEVVVFVLFSTSGKYNLLLLLSRLDGEGAWSSYRPYTN